MLVAQSRVGSRGKSNEARSGRKVMGSGLGQNISPACMTCSNKSRNHSVDRTNFIQCQKAAKGFPCDLLFKLYKITYL